MRANEAKHVCIIGFDLSVYLTSTVTLHWMWQHWAVITSVKSSLSRPCLPSIPLSSRRPAPRFWWMAKASTSARVWLLVVLKGRRPATVRTWRWERRPVVMVVMAQQPSDAHLGSNVHLRTRRILASSDQGFLVRINGGRLLLGWGWIRGFLLVVSDVHIKKSSLWSD